jgi:hypothetical protein
MELSDLVGYAIIVGAIPLTIAVSAWVIITTGNALLPELNEPSTVDRLEQMGNKDA